MRALALVAAAATAAVADPKTADRLADEAAALAKAGDHAGAARRFRDAYRTDPRAALLCNVGVSYYKAKDLPRADLYLEQCVQVGASIPAGFLAAVRDALRTIDAQLRAGDFAQVSFVVTPPTTAISVDGATYDEPFIGARTVWFPVGHYAVGFSSAGYAPQTRPLDVRAHAPSTLTVALEPVTVTVAPPPPPPRRPARPAPSLMIPIALTALAVAEAGLAIGFYAIARGHVTDANAAGDEPTHDREAASARGWRTASVITAIGGAITVGTAAMTWRRALSVEPTPGGATVAISGRF